MLFVAAEYSPFYGIEKGAVLQEARVFNDSRIDARRCQQVSRGWPPGARQSLLAAQPGWHCQSWLPTCQRGSCLSGTAPDAARQPSACVAVATGPCNHWHLVWQAQAQAPHTCRDHITRHVLQVITKLLYLLCQGETFSKVS